MQNEMTIFEQGWPGEDTVCGWGSKLEHTKAIRTLLPIILYSANAKVVNDAGCGDLFWIQKIDLTRIDYMGYDLYERSTWPALREKGWKLQTANIIEEDLRPSDLIICRDVFIHLPNELILKTLERFRRTSKWLLTTNFKSSDAIPVCNDLRMTGPNMKHSKLDLSLPPFNLGNPITNIIEDYPNKTTSIWRLK